MRLGTRWTAGDDTPSGLPDALVRGIRSVESALAADEFGNTPRPRWTLTWLEGRPVAELDTGVVVTVGPDGEPEVRHDAGDEFG